MTDRIEKTIDLKAPVERVWRALTDHREFSQWFGVQLETPFKPGQMSRGPITAGACGHDNVHLQAVVQKMEKPRYFSFTWHPYAIDPKVDYSGEPPTLVEFTLEKTAGGTRLKVVESGFDKVPAHRRAEAFTRNEMGWGIQLANITTYLQSADAA